MKETQITRTALATTWVFLFALGACPKPASLSVEVTFDSSAQGLASRTSQLVVFGGDHRVDGGVKAPIPPQLGTFTADGGYKFTITGVVGTTVSVFVNALGIDGGILASGSTQKLSALTAGNTSFQLPLFQHCKVSQDCPAQAFCAGAVTCSGAPGFEGCLPGSASAEPVGQKCGNCGGRCIDGGACWLATCGCPADLSDGGFGFIVDPSIGQYCNGTDNSDTVPDACRTNCQPAHCGDGVKDTGEKCDFDAGVNQEGRGCNETCTLLESVTTIAGDGGVIIDIDSGVTVDGFGQSASLENPDGMALSGTSLYFVQSSLVGGTAALRVIEFATLGGPGNDQPKIRTLSAGGCSNGSLSLDGGLCEPTALLPFDGGLLIADQGALRFFSFAGGGSLGTFAGQPTGASSIFSAGTLLGADAGVYGNPNGIGLLWPDIYTNTYPYSGILATTVLNETPRYVTAIANYQNGGPVNLNQGGLTILDGIVYSANESTTGQLLRFDPQNPDAGMKVITIDAGLLKLSSPSGLCSDGQHSIYICAGGTANAVLQYDIESGVLSAVAGGFRTERDGVGSQAGFLGPAGCVFDTDGGVLYVSDQSGNTIRKIE